MKKIILPGVLSFLILCSGLLVTPSPVSAVGLPACLSDQSGFTEFDSVISNVELVARLVYSEALSESMDGKKGVAQVVLNRQLKNLSEFGGTGTSSVVLKRLPISFDGMTQVTARCPQDLTQWNNSYNAASDPGSATVKVGTTLWFNKNSLFETQSKIDSSGYLVYKFPGQTNYQRVVEKKVIGNHTFFRVSGY